MKELGIENFTEITDFEKIDISKRERVFIQFQGKLSIKLTNKN